MGIVIRQSVLTTVISYFGVVLGYINLLYLYPKYLEPGQIGLLRTILDTALLMVPFAQLGLAHAITRFFPHFGQKTEAGHSFINFTLILSLFGYGFFLLIFFSMEETILSFFETNAKEILNYTHLILWLTFIMMISTLLEFYARALLKVAFPNLLREVGIRLLQAALVGLYFTKYITFNQLLLLSVGIYLATLIALAAYLVVYGGYRFHFDLSSIPRAKIREIVSYSALSFIGTSAALFISKMDSIMVSSMKGFTANAVYTTAFYMATVIEIPRRAISQAAGTVIARAYEKNDLAEVGSVYTKTAINQFIVGALLFIGVWANLHNIFKLMPNGGFYETGAFVVVIIGASKLIDMAFGPSGELIVLSRYYWFNIFAVVIFSSTGFALNYYLIPLYGVNGAAYATGIAVLLYCLIKFFFIYSMLKMQPFTPAFVKVIMICAVVVSLNMLLPVVSNIFLDIFYRSTLITLTYGSLIVVSHSSSEVNGIYHHIIRMIKSRLPR